MVIFTCFIAATFLIDVCYLAYTESEVYICVKQKKIDHKIFTFETFLLITSFIIEVDL